MKKFLKWTAIGVGGLIVLLIVYAIILDMNRTPEERAKIELERKTADSIKAAEQSIKDSLYQIEHAEEINAKYAKDVKPIAEQFAERVIKTKLKSPSSAEFDWKNYITTNNDKTWSVRGSVEAKNPFGVMINHNFRVTLKHLSGDPKDGNNWEIIDAVIE